MTKEEAKKPAAQQKACYTGLPSGGNTMELAEELDNMGITVQRKIVEDNSLIMGFLGYALMIGAVVTGQEPDPEVFRETVQAFREAVDAL